MQPDAAVTLANGQTAGEEASGRLELYLAQPVDRRMVFLGRAVATLVAVAVITGAVAVVQLGADAAVGLRIDSAHLLSTIALCALLGIFHGSLALAIAGLRGRPSLVMGTGLAVALAGCLVTALFPLSSVLAPWQHLSPWDGRSAAARSSMERRRGATSRSPSPRSSSRGSGWVPSPGATSLPRDQSASVLALRGPACPSWPSAPDTLRLERP